MGRRIILQHTKKGIRLLDADTGESMHFVFAPEAERKAQEYARERGWRVLGEIE